MDRSTLTEKTRGSESTFFVFLPDDSKLCAGAVNGEPPESPLGTLFRPLDTLAASGALHELVFRSEL